MTILRTGLGANVAPAKLITTQQAGFLTETNVQDALNRLAAVIPPSAEIRVVTASGVVAITALDIEVGINKTTPAVTAVTLPAEAAWRSATQGTTLELVIKDLAGNASTYPITITPDGTETIDSLSSIVLSADFGELKLRPRPGVGWYIR